MANVIYRSTGVEELLDQVEEVLIRDINDMLAEVYERRVEADQARAARRRVEYIPLTYEEVPAANFHSGNFPSLALEQVPKDSYPYIVLTVEDWAPTAESARLDHVNSYRDALSVHCLASASPKEHDPPELVYRRALRMGEAVYLALASSTSMRSALAGFDNPTRGQSSIPWTDQHKGHGDDWWFQSVGTSYGLRAYTSMYQ